MRDLFFDVTVRIRLSVEDTFQVSPEAIVRAAMWKANDYTDGRHPFSTEMVFEGLSRIIERNAHEAVFQYACELPQCGDLNTRHWEEKLTLRNKWIEKVSAKIRWARETHDENDADSNVVRVVFVKEDS